MSWKGFKKGLNELLHPRWVQEFREMSPEEKERRRRVNSQHTELGFLAFMIESDQKRLEEELNALKKPRPPGADPGVANPDADDCADRP